MAKKFVRGITDIKDINKQDFDTNNVNDLLSDGQYNYIHRKKGKAEEYHNLTDNIKTISSDNTELLSVTNNNKTTNTATLHPKHDAQKEQVLESTRNTIAIHHATNGTAEKTTVDTNPKKVLEHDNLVSASEYVTIEHDAQSEISQIKTDKLKNVINGLSDKIPDTVGTVNLFKGSRDFRGSEWKNNSNGDYVEDYQGVKIFKTNTIWEGRSQHFEVKTGEEYVFSAYVKSSAETDRVVFYLVNSNKQPQAAGVVSFESVNNPGSVEFNLSDKYKRIAIKIKITQDGWIMPRLERNNTNAYLFFGGYKLERYNVPTDYSPNPQDVYPLLAQKEQVLESTRNTISINHGTNGTDEKTTVDTNPQKVLEHENLISDSEYITLQHQTGENTTHIQTAALKEKLDNLQQTKQDTLVAGDGITIQGNTISASAPVQGATVSIQDFSSTTQDFYAIKHVVTIGQKTLTTFSFELYNENTEIVLTGEFKEELAKFIGPGYSASNGALSITNDGTNMKLINSTPEYHNIQHATFTFYRKTGGGGGGGSV